MRLDKAIRFYALDILKRSISPTTLDGPTAEMGFAMSGLLIVGAVNDLELYWDVCKGGDLGRECLRLGSEFLRVSLGQLEIGVVTGAAEQLGMSENEALALVAGKPLPKRPEIRADAPSGSPAIVEKEYAAGEPEGNPPGMVFIPPGTAFETMTPEQQSAVRASKDFVASPKGNWIPKAPESLAPSSRPEERREAPPEAYFPKTTTPEGVYVPGTGMMRAPASAKYPHTPDAITGVCLVCECPRNQLNNYSCRAPREYVKPWKPELPVLPKRVKDKRKKKGK